MVDDQGADVTDEYQISGEFLDLLSGPAWQALRVPVAEALRGAAPDAPVVDIGAGTGLGTAVLAGVFPAADILAVEPSPTLRAVLLARCAADADLSARVTVVAGDALGVDLPDRLGAVLAANVVGHLDPAGRREVWRRVADRLAPGAPLVVNLQPPAEAVSLPETTFGAVQVGRQTYEVSGGAEPTGPDTVTWRMRYRVLGPDGTAVRETTVSYRWYVLSPPRLLAELAEAGLEGAAYPLDVVRAVRSH